MKVSPISETVANTQANAFRVWPRGAYDFEVLTAIDKRSKSGNEMVELELRVHDRDGKTRKLRDWLVESEGVAYKVRHFAAATGMLAQYEKGELKTDQMPGKTGRCKLGIEKGNDKYPDDRNKIDDYIAAGGPLIASVPDPQLNDDIPF